MVALPDKPSVVALIDVDKVARYSCLPSNQGNLMDILQQKFLKSIPFWDGTCSKVGSRSWLFDCPGRSVRPVRPGHRGDGHARPPHWQSLQNPYSKGVQTLLQ